MVTVHTNQRVLEFDRARNREMISPSSVVHNSVIIPPCFLGDNVVVKNAVIGPHVSIGANSKISDSRISNTNIQSGTLISGANIIDSMIGNNVHYKGKARDLSIGDYTTIDE